MKKLFKVGAILFAMLFMVTIIKVGTSTLDHGMNKGTANAAVQQMSDTNW